MRVRRVWGMSGAQCRYVYLQFFQHRHYQTLAESNRIAIVPIVPNRGVVTDRNGVELAISDAGEVLARSNVVLQGYWQQPDATADALDGGWFHTGDGGSIDDEGYLTISDRKKDVIITGGENVSSIEVEDCLYSLEGVAECAVIGVPDEKWGETIKAIVVLAPGATLDEAAVIAHCKQKMAGYKSPTSVDIVEVIPRTATGKVQKFKLREPYWQGRDRQVN